MNELLKLSGVAQAVLIRKREVSSAELFDAHHNRIIQIDPALNAVVETLPYQTPAPGPFSGVPFSIKDSIEVKGTVCTAGTMGLRNAPPSKNDATLVSRIRAAGGIPLARTNLPDLLFAFETDNLLRGRTNNPYDLTRTPGGSSGGEAALIAACGSPFGLGSDCLGSVRVPAHFCGIATIKPTSGRLPRTGHVPPKGSWFEALWQIGPMARHVEDLIALMPILIGGDGQDESVIGMPWREPEANLRIGYFTDNGIARATPETIATVLKAAKALNAAEHRPQGIEASYDLIMTMIAPDGGTAMRAAIQSLGSNKTHPLLEAWLKKHEPYRTDLKGFGDFWARLDTFRASMYRTWNDYDVLLSPVCANAALPHGTSIEQKNFLGFSYTMTWNVTGNPAAVVRCGTSPEGLPIGVQVIAKHWREDTALAVAKRLEDLFGGWRGTGVIN